MFFISRYTPVEEQESSSGDESEDDDEIEVVDSDEESEHENQVDTPRPVLCPPCALLPCSDTHP